MRALRSMDNAKSKGVAVCGHGPKPIQVTCTFQSTCQKQSVVVQNTPFSSRQRIGCSPPELPVFQTRAWSRFQWPTTNRDDPGRERTSKALVHPVLHRTAQQPPSRRGQQRQSLPVQAHRNSFKPVKSKEQRLRQREPKFWGKDTMYYKASMYRTYLQRRRVRCC
jgi:hypothetical protein